MEGKEEGGGGGRSSERESQPGTRDQQKASAGNLQISSLLTHSKLPQGTMELKPVAQGSQQPPRGSGLEMQGGVWSAVSFPARAGARSLPVALPSSLPLLLQAALKLIRDPNT